MKQQSFVTNYSQTWTENKYGSTEKQLGETGTQFRLEIIIG